METLKKDWKEVRYVGWERSMSPTIEREKRTMERKVVEKTTTEREVCPLMVISFMTTMEYLI
jgi:hypothetical protein